MDGKMHVNHVEFVDSLWNSYLSRQFISQKIFWKDHSHWFSFLSLLKIRAWPWNSCPDNFLVKFFEKLIKLKFLTFQNFFSIFLLFFSLSYFLTSTCCPCTHTTRLTRAPHAPDLSVVFSGCPLLLVTDFWLVFLPFFFPLGLFLLPNTMSHLLHENYDQNTFDWADYFSALATFQFFGEVSNHP